MDKYTVDLDQVLNDFEYSELTDHYSHNNAPARVATGSTAPPIQNVTKHSINNVFHSLNEYLNTSINVNSINQIDNNLLESKDHCTDDTGQASLNVDQTRFKEEEKPIEDCNLKTELLLDLRDDVKENSSNGSIFNNGVNIFDRIGDSRDIDHKKTEDSGTEVEEIVDTPVKTVKNEEKEDEIAEQEERVEKAEDPDLENKIEDKPDEKREENEEIQNDEQTKNENTVDKMEVEEVFTEDKVKEESDKQVVSSFIEAEKKVGFTEDIDLDDNEISKLLDELETEEELNNKESQNTEHEEACEDDVETKECQSCDPQVQDTVTKDTPVDDAVENVGVEENLEHVLVESEDKAVDKIEENVEVVSSPTVGDNDSNIEVKLESSNEDIKVKNATEDVNGDNIVENKVPKLVDEKPPTKDTVQENVTEKYCPETEEETSQEFNKSKDTVEENVGDLDIEKDTSQDSLSRPQDLPLQVKTAEEPKRKINLIGDPGSTPYNNVYINKEIPKNKNKEYDSDTDYSTSSSPTFSDASSTASTASLDEARRDGKNSDNPVKVRDDTEIQVDREELSRTASITDNPTPTESHTDNPTSENENPISDPALAGSQGESESEGAALGGFGADEAVSSGSGVQNVERMGEENVSDINVGKQWLGKEAPLWIPDSDATSCLHCDMKFTVLKRRHHCRACGLVLCSKCCHLRFRLEYLDAEARVCNKCHDILNKDTNSSSGSDLSPEQGNSPSHRPNPNNPLEYCSTVSPLQQAASSNPNPPAVMVPVGVLKRKGSNKAKSNKSVMFCDGIRPGSDLTNLDNDFDYNNTKTKRAEKSSAAPPKVNRNLPTTDAQTKTFIPSSENSLPPTVTVFKTDISYFECLNDPKVVETLKDDQLTFAIHVNLYVHLRIINMSCCINKMAWCFSTEGLINVGQDEIVILLEYIDEESFVPKDVFFHINNVYNDAVKGNSVKELGLSLHNASNFLDSKNHAGFVYIRPTFQCLENVIKPKEPYLIGILIHRWETPWAKLFPLRLVLRLGAEYRYYPSPIISTRHRESVFVEIGHTIINLLADFRNFSYTLPQIRGLTIHMEDKNTTITIPVNRYDQVMKSINNSSDHILAFAGNFSLAADSHLVCIQDTQGNENCYSTHAINIHNKPRKITGASFIVFNGALKTSSGLTAKSNIVEDGLMIQVLPEHMQQIRDNLRAMKNHTVPCGCVNAATDETVNIVWGENDVNFNVGVMSSIDNLPLSGVPSIRVHNGKNHVCVNGSRLIRWTEVFIIKGGEDNPKSQDPIDVSRISEGIAKATCDALVKYLDLLIANSCQKIGIRTTLHVDNVSYLAGSNGAKLPPIYMKSLDDELIPVLHRITTGNLGENAIVLELVFRILNV